MDAPLKTRATGPAKSSEHDAEGAESGNGRGSWSQEQLSGANDRLGAGNTILDGGGEQAGADRGAGNDMDEPVDTPISGLGKGFAHKDEPVRRPSCRLGLRSTLIILPQDEFEEAGPSSRWD